jgi:Flp pilus assembly pilin Flp
MTRFFRRLARFWRAEDGVAAMEFVLMVPVLLAVFLSAFECALLMTRSILLEHAVDVTMRELRLGHYGKVTNALLKDEICRRTILFEDCSHNISIQLDRVSQTNWSIPTPPPQCVNSDDESEPVVALEVGQSNELMLARVCVSLPAIFPGMGLALRLPQDELGDYALVARTTFVVEPS